MDHSNVTITLPMTGHGLGVILTALGIGVGTGIVWLILSEQDRAPRGSPANLLGAFALIMVPVWLVIFTGTLWQVWQLLSSAQSALGSGPSLGMGALLAALLGAPFVVWGTMLKQQTVDFQKEGHITDRITAAVEQLGAEKTVKKIVDGATQETSEPNIEVRIGAILSLERIAQDSTRYDKGRDHVRVMEILCAYVRENSNIRPPRAFPLPEWAPLPNNATAEDRNAHEAWSEARFANRFNSNAREWAASLPKPRADIAQALQVLGRRTEDQRLVEAAWPDPPSKDTKWPFDAPCPEFPEASGDAPINYLQIDEFKEKLKKWSNELSRYSGYRLDLRETNLQGIDLPAERPNASDAVFSGALLQRARMEGAKLMGARMVGAFLDEIRIEGADLWEVQMQGVNLRHARMEGVDLSQARIAGADLWGARIEVADLSGALIQGSVLRRSNMEDADLSGALMQFADLAWARMERADLGEARMEGVILRAARMEGADLGQAWMDGAILSEARMDSHTSLSAATLRGAALRDVDYSEVPISAEQVKSTFGDASVILPKSIVRPNQWPSWNMKLKVFYTEWRKWQADPEGYTPPPKPEG